jgi:hypothetical protein
MFDLEKLNKHYQDKNTEYDLWHDIRTAAQTNLTLQAALDQCIMIYKLSETNSDGL